MRCTHKNYCLFSTRNSFSNLYVKLQFTPLAVSGYSILSLANVRLVENIIMYQHAYRDLVDARDHRPVRSLSACYCMHLTSNYSHVS